MPAREYGYVYIASTNIYLGKGIFKVGSTNDLARRLRELSAKSSSPEEFFIVYFVRCENLKSAQALEKAVHLDLDEEEFRLNPNREFFETETVLPIVRSIIETAQYIEIPIIKQDYHKLVDLLDNEPSIPLPADRLLELDDVSRRAYKRAAKDLSLLMSAFLVGKLEVKESLTGPEKEVYGKLMVLISQIQNRLDLSLEAEGFEYMVPLDHVFVDAMRFENNEEDVKAFRSRLKDYLISERENESFYFEPKPLQELKEELKKYKTRMKFDK